MAQPTDPPASFLGRGWSFPPRFSRESGVVRMSADETDIQESLHILFATAVGERFLVPTYGLDMHELLFEPVSTTMRTFLKDRIRTVLLIFEPRIKLLAVEILSPDPHDGSLRVMVDYEVRATNSRYNLVFPFYRHDGNEVRGSVDVTSPARASR